MYCLSFLDMLSYLNDNQIKRNIVVLSTIVNFFSTKYIHIVDGSLMLSNKSMLLSTSGRIFTDIVDKHLI